VSGPDALLGGRVRLDQTGAGLRATIDPVLLAAAVPARAGESVLEAGTGIGTAALCLLARVAVARVVGVERDPDQAARAAANAALNGWGERFAAIAADLAGPEAGRDLAAFGPFDHAMANPPWFEGGTTPRIARRREAKHGGDALAGWIGVLARALAPRGSLTLVLPPSLLPAALAGFAGAGVGAPVIHPLWPRAGAPARRLILSGRKGRRSPCRILAGLVLHEADGRFTAAAEAVLRHAEALSLA
jgi:tRNA1(Val) A37 N6-methylase TrmN6